MTDGVAPEVGLTKGPGHDRATGAVVARNLLRISIGIENLADLIADPGQPFVAV